MAKIGFEGLRKFALFTAFSALALFAAPPEGDSALAESLPKAKTASGPEFAGKKAGLIVLEGDVDQTMATYAARAIGKALESSPDLLVFEINTYGGRLDAAFDISDTMLAVKIPTVALVDKKAISAGALISLSAQKLYMRPSTTIGDCAPILQGNEGPVMLGEKIQSPLRARFRTFAEKHGYPSLLAQAMVSEELEVVELTRGDSSRLLLSTALEELPEKETEGWTRRTLVQRGELLTLTDKEAERFGFSAGTVENAPKLMEALGVASYEKVELDWGERFAKFVASIAPILMMLGFGALYIEFKTPGFGVFGIVGILLVGLVFLAQFAPQLDGYLPAILLVAGVALFLVEIFVMPGTFLFGLGGIVCMILALALSFSPDELPEFVPESVESAFDATPWLLGLLYMLSCAAAALVFPIAASKWLIPLLPEGWTPMLKTDLETAVSPTEAAQEVSVGDVGEAKTFLRPVGQALFGDKLFDVQTRGEIIEAGARVKVVAVQEGHVWVVQE